MAADLPEGFRYESELIGPEDEAALLAFVRELSFRDFEFHGYTGKRPRRLLRLALRLLGTAPAEG